MTPTRRVGRHTREAALDLIAMCLLVCSRARRAGGIPHTRYAVCVDGERDEDRARQPPAERPAVVFFEEESLSLSLEPPSLEREGGESLYSRERERGRDPYIVRERERERASEREEYSRRDTSPQRGIVIIIISRRIILKVPESVASQAWGLGKRRLLGVGRRLPLPQPVEVRPRARVACFVVV